MSQDHQMRAWTTSGTLQIRRWAGSHLIGLVGCWTWSFVKNVTALGRRSARHQQTLGLTPGLAAQSTDLQRPRVKRVTLVCHSG